MDQKLCEYYKLGYCKIDHCVGVDCSLYGLKLDKESIKQHIKNEIKRIRAEPLKNHEKQDTIYGIKILAEIYTMHLKGRLEEVIRPSDAIYMIRMTAKDNISGYLKVIKNKEKENETKR